MGSLLKGGGLVNHAIDTSSRLRSYVRGELNDLDPSAPNNVYDRRVDAFCNTIGEIWSIHVWAEMVPGWIKRGLDPWKPGDFETIQLEVISEVDNDKMVQAVYRAYREAGGF